MKNSNKYRKVGDDEITPYQGWGGKEQMQRAQSRKRRQVRRRESSVFDGLPEDWKPLAKVFVALGFLAICLIPFVV